MRRYERIAAGLATLLVLGTTGARENPASLAPFTFALTVGECITYDSSTSMDSTPYGFDPAGTAIWSLRNILRLRLPEVPDYGFPGTQSTILRQPKHGTLVANNYANGTSFRYRSDMNYVGKDGFTALVRIPGYPPVKVIYYLMIEPGPGGHFKFLHLWPGQIPPVGDDRTGVFYSLVKPFASRLAASLSR